MITARDVLKRAADLIERKGLAKGQPVDYSTGAICGLYAISFAGAELFAELELREKQSMGYRASQTLNAVELLNNYMHDHSPRSQYRGIVHWSDNPDTTKEEVVHAFREAAK